jgi:2-methylisocitrate lyase-like PEP mutase family enzyme
MPRIIAIPPVGFVSETSRVPVNPYGDLGSAGTIDAMAEVSGGSLNGRCDLLRSLHVPGAPLVLPNAWDVASAKAVAAAGFPVVATTSGGVAEALGFEDEQDAPVEEMLAAATRITRSVAVPVTVDFEAGYGLSPEAMVDRLLAVGAAGCNLEDTDHVAGRLVETKRHAAWLANIRGAATARGYGLVINARVDVFIGRTPQDAPELFDEAVVRARAYIAAGADCVYPIVLHEADVIQRFVAAVGGRVNIFQVPPAPSNAELAAMGVARISYGSSIHRESMRDLAAHLERIDRLQVGRPDTGAPLES